MSKTPPLDYLNSGRYSAQAAAKSVAGRCNPEFLTAHNRAQAVFLCVMHSYTQSMVGRAGQPSGWPGSVGTGIATPVRSTTSKRCNFSGGLLLLPTEVAIMATIPPRFIFIFRAIRKNDPDASLVHLHARTNTERQARKCHEAFYDLELIQCSRRSKTHRLRHVMEVSR